MSSFKDKIIGSFELLLLFGRGVNRFSGTKSEGLKSIIVAVLVFLAQVPFNIYICPPKGMETGYSHAQIFITLVTSFVVAYVFGAIVIWQFAAWLERSDRFWLYFSACNWTQIPANLICVPFMVMLAYGVDRDQMDTALTFLMLYGYVVLGVISCYALRLNWQIAIGFATTAMFVDREVLRLVYQVQGIPWPWKH